MWRCAGLHGLCVRLRGDDRLDLCGVSRFNSNLGNGLLSLRLGWRVTGRLLDGFCCRLLLGSVRSNSRAVCWRLLGRRVSLGGGAAVFARSLGSALFAAFDQVAVGITLTLAAVAAATLAARTTARAFACLSIVLLVLEHLRLFQQLFVTAVADGCFLARCTLFTRRTWCTFFARLAFGTLLAVAGFWCFQCFAQLTRAAFFTIATLAAVVAILSFARCAFFTGLTLFAWCTLLARLTLFARCAFLTWGTLFARSTLLAGLTFFACSALFAWLALFIAAIAIGATIAVTIATLLAAVTALLAGARLALHRCFDDYLLFLFAGKQTDQRLDQALEQAGLYRRGFRDQRCGWLWCCRARRGGLDSGFLAYQGAGGADRLSFFDLGLGHFIAALAVQGLGAVITQALHFEVRCFQMVVGQDDDARA